MKKTLKDFATQEPPGFKKLQAALEDLGDRWVWTDELRTLYKISSSTLQRHGPRFDAYRLLVSGRYLWSGSKELIAKIQEQI